MGAQLSIFSGFEDGITFNQAFELYQAYLAHSHLRESTQSEYLIDVRQLLTFLKQQGIIGPQDVSLSHLKQFLVDLDNREVGAAARRRKGSVIKAFFSFLKANNCIRNNPAPRLILPPRPEPKTTRISAKQIRRLVEAAASHPRDSAIIQIFAQTRIKVGEMLRLTTGDVVLSPEQNMAAIRVRRKQEMVYLPLDAFGLQALETWLAVRPRTQYPNLFLTRLKKPMQRSAYRRVVAKYASIAGVGRLTPRIM